MNAKPEDKQAALLLLMMTVFHESVHLGVNKNKLPKNSINGNWEKRGFLYLFKGQPHGYVEGCVFCKNLEAKYKDKVESLSTEDGKTL